MSDLKSLVSHTEGGGPLKALIRRMQQMYSFLSKITSMVHGEYICGVLWGMGGVECETEREYLGGSY